MSQTLEGGYLLRKGLPQTCPNLKVSIITVVFNGEKYLEQTILSVLNQSYKNIEYIIIDGGSTDSSIDIIRKYDDEIAYWISEPDKGISDAFNKGIKIASGTLIGIINADDWYETNAVASIVQRYRPGSVLHGNLQYWNRDGTKGMLVIPNSILLPREMTINHPTVFIEKDGYDKIGLFDSRYKLAMDYHLLLRLHDSGFSFIDVDNTVANMRSGGASHNWLGSYKEVRRAKDEILGKKVKHAFIYYWQILRRTASESFSDSPLSFVNRVYRRYFSPMKKM